MVRKANTADVKTKTGGNFKYTYATLGDVALAAYPVLSKHGLAFIVTTESTDYGLLAVGKLVHESGECIGAEFPVYRGSPQEIGSGLTYARRYLLGCLSGIVTDDDDDGQQAQQAAVRPNNRGVEASKAQHPTNTSPLQSEAATAPNWDDVLAQASAMTDEQELIKLGKWARSNRAPKAVMDDLLTLVGILKSKPKSAEPEPEPAPADDFAPVDDSDPWGMEAPKTERHQTP